MSARRICRRLSNASRKIRLRGDDLLSPLGHSAAATATSAGWGRSRVRSRVGRATTAALRNCDTRRAAALIAFRCKDLVVVCAEVQTCGLPCIGVVGERDSAARALALADAPELLERLGAIDRRLVDTGARVEVVGAAIAGEATLRGRLLSRVVRSKGLENLGTFRSVLFRTVKCVTNVVLDEWVRRPTINGQV